jgi:hypothetical protein
MQQLDDAKFQNQEISSSLKCQVDDLARENALLKDRLETTSESTRKILAEHAEENKGLKIELTI